MIIHRPKETKKDSLSILIKPMNDQSASSPDRSLGLVFDGEIVRPPPVWLMRQAGRYLPEYRALRSKSNGFLDLCFDPELAAEITLQPIARFDMDAAILFSDILMVPWALGRKVEFVDGEGPRLEPIDENGIDRLQRDGLLERLRPVHEAAALVRSRLDPKKSLIGFCGAPWTVATYMVAGHGTSDQGPARYLAATNPQAFQRLIDELVSASVDHLVGQIRSGADVVQIFDTWAGVLGEVAFERWCVAPTAEIVRRVKSAAPAAKVIGFPRGAGLMIERYIEATAVDGVSIDWAVPLAFARDRLQPLAVVQGNLDPITVVAGGDGLDQAVDRILAALASGRFIFNLGHGISPQTPVENVARLIARVRARS